MGRQDSDTGVSGLGGEEAVKGEGSWLAGEPRGLQRGRGPGVQKHRPFPSSSLSRK